MKIDLWHPDSFAHGHPHFCVALALAYGRELRLGIVHDPVRDETWFARRGNGAKSSGTTGSSSREASSP